MWTVNQEYAQLLLMVLLLTVAWFSNVYIHGRIMQLDHSSVAAVGADTKSLSWMSVQLGEVLHVLTHVWVGLTRVLRFPQSLKHNVQAKW